MRDVAAHAGVSLKTVSRVVNGEAGVSGELATRVLRAIEDLDYRPNIGASSLRRSDQKTATVGLLLEDVSNPFSAALQRAVEDVAIPRGVLVFSVSLDEDPAREQELTRALSTRRPDGLLLVPAGDDQSYLASELHAGTAIVCLDRAAHGLPVDSVLTTNATGSAEGVRHLIAAGHHRIGFLSDRMVIATARQRYEGYCDALRGAGLPVDSGLVAPDLCDASRAEAATLALLNRHDPPTALFTSQNMVTIGALRALRRLGAERRVALVGFDDFPLADLLSPGVTVVAQDPVTIGRTGADLLFRRIDGYAGPPATVLVPTTLIPRGSGEIPPPAGRIAAPRHRRD